MHFILFDYLFTIKLFYYVHITVLIHFILYAFFFSVHTIASRYVELVIDLDQNVNNVSHKIAVHVTVRVCLN